MSTTDTAPADTRTTLYAGLVVLALGVAAYLTLVLTGHDDQTDKLLTFLGPSVAALIVVGHAQRQQAETKQQLAVITRQTNGVLDQRIKENTTAALKDYDMTEDVRVALADMLEAHLTDRAAPMTEGRSVTVTEQSFGQPSPA
jgi:hypothetical protein